MLANPGALTLLLLLPLAALFLSWRSWARRMAIRQLGDPQLLTALTDGISGDGRAIGHRRRVKSGLWMGVLLGVVLALARPSWGVQVEALQTQGVSVLFVLDVSTSMTAEDVLPNRLERAKLDAQAVLDARVGDAFGLILFAGDAFVQFPLTVDSVAASAFLRAATTDAFSRQGTATEQALRLALATLPSAAAAPSVIVLLTDGETHEGDPVAAAQEAAARGVTVHVIGYGTPDGALIPLRDGAGNITAYKADAQGALIETYLDETALMQIASQTGGVYYRAADTPTAAVEVVEAIGTLERGVLTNRPTARPVERFGVFVALALALLTLEIFLPEKRRSTGVKR